MKSASKVFVLNKEPLIFSLMSLIFFFSGFTSLGYEVIWFKRFSQLLGSSTYAQIIVVSTFLTGLAAGAYVIGKVADRVPSPLRVYAFFELAIGIFAFLFPFEMNEAKHIFNLLQSVLPKSVFFDFLSMTGLSFSLIGIPCFLMGGTLPLLLRNFIVTTPWKHESTGWLYAINTLGAAVGCLLTGFSFLPGFGMEVTNYVLVFFNGVIFLAAYRMSTVLQLNVDHDARDKGNPEEPSFLENPAFIVNEAVMWMALFLTGCAALILQFVWTRKLAVLLGSTTYAFSSILFVYLLGIALGSLFYSRKKYLFRRVVYSLSILILILLGTITLGYLLIPILTILVAALRLYRADFLYNLIICVFVSSVMQLIPTFVMGILFPYLLDITRASSLYVGSITGKLYAFNTLGGILGSIITPLILLELSGSPLAFSLSLLLYFLAYFFLVYPQTGGKKGLVINLVAVVLCVSMTSKPMNPLQTDMGMYIYGLIRFQDIQNDHKLLYFKESTHSNVVVTEAFNQRSLRVNGKVDASDSGDMQTQIGLAVTPLIFSPKPNKIFVVGYGSGVSAGICSLFPESQVTCCEIDKAVIDAGKLFRKVNHFPELRPNFHIVIDDGRKVMEMSKDRFDIIISEPSNPWLSGISNLYSAEFYRVAKERLSEKGLFAQWLQTYKFTNANYTMVLKTIKSVFKYTTVFIVGGSDTLVIGSDYDIFADSSIFPKAQQWIDRSEPISEDLQLYFKTKDVKKLVLNSLLIDDQSVNALLSASPEVDLNTDINMKLEFNAPLRLFLSTEKQEDVDRFLLSWSDQERWLNLASRMGGKTAYLDVMLSRLKNLKENNLTDLMKKMIASIKLIDPQNLEAKLYEFSLSNEFDAYTKQLIDTLVDKDPSLLMENVVLRINQEKYDLSLDYLTYILAKRPQWPMVHVYIGNVYYKLKNFDQAEKYYREALAIDPSIVEINKLLWSIEAGREENRLNLRRKG